MFPTAQDTRMWELGVHMSEMAPEGVGVGSSWNSLVPSKGMRPPPAELPPAPGPGQWNPMNFQTGQLSRDFAILWFSCPVCCSALPANLAGIALGSFPMPVPGRMEHLEHGGAASAGHSPWDLLRHLLRIPRNSNEPWAGKNTFLLGPEAVGFLDAELLPGAHFQLLFCLWSLHGSSEKVITWSWDNRNRFHSSSPLLHVRH